MARRQFLVLYPDGSRKHVDREERDSLLYAQEIKETGFREYRFTVAPRSYRLSATQNTLPSLSLEAKATPPVVRRYLGIDVIFQLGEKRYHEHEESTEGMVLRFLKTQEGAVA